MTPVGQMEMGIAGSSPLTRHQVEAQTNIAMAAHYTGNGALRWGALGSIGLSFWGHASVPREGLPAS